MKAATLVLTLVTGLTLGGCDKQAADPNAQAGGEILPRSVTDEMPPYDTVRSQPPLANPTAATGGGAGRGGAEASASEASVPAGEVGEAAPAEEPAAEAGQE